MNSRRCFFLEILISASSVSVVSDIWREEEVYLVERLALALALALGANAEAVVTAERRRAADVNFILMSRGKW